MLGFFCSNHDSGTALPPLRSWPSAKRPRDLGFCASAPGAVAPPTRRVSQQRDSATPRQGACAHTARSTDLQFVPVPHLPRCCSARAFRSSAELASAIRQKGSLRGDPRSSPALRSRSLAVRALLRGLRLLRARLPREVPGFGAVLIARSARVTDRGARLPADLRSVSEPAAGARQPSPSEPARGQAVDRCHVFGCLLDREGFESPLSPQSARS